MKRSLLHRSLVATVFAGLLGAAVPVLLPGMAMAGGNESPYYDRLQLQKLATQEQVDSLKAGDLVVRSCPHCGSTAVHKLKKSIKGNYELLNPKCSSCGKEGVHVTAKTAVPFKETVKR